MASDDQQVEMNKDLLEIKGQIRKPVKKRLHKDEVSQITSQLKDLSNKVEEIKENLGGGKESHTKLKKKKEIIYLIKNKGKITTSKLSDEIDLSRTRCSEYLNEMKREGILESKKDGRKKFYKLEL